MPTASASRISEIGSSLPAFRCCLPLNGQPTGWPELAWLAGDHGVALAERTGDPILAALTGFRVAIALTSLGRADSAFNLNVSYAYRLQPGLRTEADRSAYGHILLQAAMA